MVAFGIGLVEFCISLVIGCEIICKMTYSVLSNFCYCHYYYFYVCFDILCCSVVYNRCTFDTMYRLIKQSVSLPFVCQVKASDPAVISGYLSMSVDRKTWHRRWFSVHCDFVLYSFKAHQVLLTCCPIMHYYHYVCSCIASFR